MVEEKKEKITPYATRFIDPQVIINQLQISPGMVVAHFGCGSGHFTFPVAKKIGNTGKVYAFDVLEEKIENIISRAKLEGYGNISAQRTNLEKERGTKLDDETVDWVIIVSMLFQNQNKEKVIAEAKRILKKNGKMLIIDWGKTQGLIGPKIKNRFFKEDLIKLMEQFSLKISKEMKVSDLHFAIVAVK